MIDELDHSDETKNGEAALTHVRRLAAWYDRPPLPLSGVSATTDLLITARTVWQQDRIVSAEISRPTAAPLEEDDPIVRADVRNTPNPLRALAADLLRFADQCEQHGLVPLGINVQTDYTYDWRPQVAYAERHKDRLAAVHVSVRCVSARWAAES